MDTARKMTDCLNPALTVEYHLGAVRSVAALHIAGRQTMLREPPPVVFIDGVEYRPA